MSNSPVLHMHIFQNKLSWARYLGTFHFCELQANHQPSSLVWKTAARALLGTIYNEIPTLCHSHPTILTFDKLLKICTISQRGLYYELLPIYY